MSGTQRPLVRREGLIPGPPGNAGPPGGIGPAGVPGPIGPIGPAGPQGTGITPKGSVASPSALPTTGNSPGDLYIVTSSGDGYNSGDGYSYTGSGNDAGPGGNWHNIGPIRGPQGPQGPQGNTGATGAQGPQGTQGVQGNTGPQGPQGNPTTVNGKTGVSITLAASDVGAAALGRTAVADANYTILRTDVYVAMTTLSAGRTLTLPSASAYPLGQALFIADESGNGSTYTITIAAAGSDTIAGQPTANMSFSYQKLTFHSNGANLWTVA